MSSNSRGVLPNYKIKYGVRSDIDAWMAAVGAVNGSFPGLETAQELAQHRSEVLDFMDRREALCVKQGGAVVGVLLFSKKYNMVCCLCVLPQYRRRKIASGLLQKALSQLNRQENITVTTFRTEDAGAAAPRSLYKNFGFVEDELTEEFGCLTQKFVLPAIKL